MKIKSIYDIPNFESEKLYLKKYNVYDWFEVYLFKGGCTIKSGLRNADETIKSPYYYERYYFGKDYKKEALKDFNNFLKKKKLI